MNKLVIIAASAFMVGTMANVSANGQKDYQASCFACHGTGAAGAPKVGDKAAWKDRIAQGKAKLYEHSIKGFKGKTGFMPAKGGSSLSDGAIKAVVDYMVEQSK